VLGFPATARRRLALTAVLGGGAAIRIWFMRSYRPAFLGYPDARAYVIAARGPLYWNQYKPVGYPLLLRGLRSLDGRLSSTIAVQHGLGLATAGLIYSATRPHLERGSLALLPASVVAFGGSQVWLEHAVLSDAPYTFLLALALACAERSPRRGELARAGWLAGAGAAIGLSVTLRTVGVFLAPGLAGWAFAQRRRLSDAGALTAPVGLILFAYLVPQAKRTGRWGLTRSGSFTFYARMAPIADCARFVAPPGTEALCESTPPAQRANLNWYVFDRESPAIRRFGDPPYPLQDAPKAAYRWAGEEPTRRFARAVLRHQPLDYARTVLEGLVNYVKPRFGRRSVFEYDQPMLIRSLHDEHYEELAGPDVSSYYTTPPGYLRRDVRRLEAYGMTMRTEGWVTATLALLALRGCVVDGRQAASTARLFSSTALGLAVFPVAILFYDVRYGAPMVVPLSAAAAIGIDRCLDGLIPRRCIHPVEATRSC
jgi:hypothetical protein